LAPAGSDVPGTRESRWERGGQEPASRARRVILYTVKRYLDLLPGQWDELSWDIQKTYLQGLAEDETVPFTWREPEAGELTPGVSGPQIRENVDMGQRVFDLTAFRAELEADRARRQQEGGEPGV
jgi:hypothetical protein